MRLYWRLFTESVLFAWNALKANKLRTFLSLLMVTIGVFSIIAVFTISDSMAKYVRNSFEELGDKVLFIQKWPWNFGPDYHWWDYISRPEASLDDLRSIEKQSQLASSSTFMIGYSRTLKFGSSSMENVQIQASTPGFEQVRDFEIAERRYFTEADFSGGAPYCIIGDYIRIDLFGYKNPIGKSIKIGGIKATVIGVFERQGESLIGQSTDELVLIPMNFAKTMVDIKSGRLGPTIYVKAKEGVSNEALRDEMTIVMRGARKLKPRQDDNFAINEVSMITNSLGSFFDSVNVIGAIISLFSLLVGGFGIANIMFVSVKERVNLIGIQKSLGAKNSFILFEFLVEAVVLCVLGGSFGMLLVLGIGLLVSSTMEMNFILSIGNTAIGLLISVIIGLISGIVPAFNASRMDPVEAIRAKG